MAKTDETETPEETAEEAGQFWALGAEHVSTVEGEWTVDPETGMVTGLSDNPRPVTSEPNVPQPERKPE